MDWLETIPEMYTEWIQTSYDRSTRIERKMIKN